MHSEAEKLKCVERELSYRRFVYPRRIEAGRMTREKADREIALMQEIVDDYRARALAESPKLL